MKILENKQSRALRQFEEAKSTIMKIFIGAPSYGATSMKIHWMDGEVKRIVMGYKESLILGEDEHSQCT
jgi:hypothetical protein